MTIEEKFQSVPRRIRDWFWSDEMDQIIADLEQKYGLPESETDLPVILFDVEIKDLDFSDLRDVIEDELGLPSEKASALYEDVKARIFMPLARDFVAFGIGVGELSTEPSGATELPLPVPVSPVVPASLPVGDIKPPQGFPMPSGIPAPVPLYRDTIASETALPTARFDIKDTGDISRSTVATPGPQRAAHIDLGIPAAPRKDAEFRSVFVERATPLPEISAVDYVPPQPLPAEIPAPVPLSAAPAPVFDTPAVQPSIEVVTTQQATPPNDDPPASGIFGTFLHRIAPWHARRFGRKPLPTVNYSEPASAPPMPAPAPIQDVPPASPPPAA